MKKFAIALSIFAVLAGGYLYLDSFIVLRGSGNLDEKKETHRIRMTAQYGRFTANTQLEPKTEFRIVGASFTINKMKHAAVINEGRREYTGFDSAGASFFPDLNGDGVFPEYEEFPGGEYTLNLEYSVDHTIYKNNFTVHFERHRRLNLPSIFVGWSM